MIHQSSENVINISQSFSKKDQDEIISIYSKSHLE